MEVSAGMGNASRDAGALAHVRICDLSGQLAGAGATRVLAAFGAQVIRIEDPVTRGLWDIVRQIGPYVGDDHGPDGGTGFINHNVEKLGITLNLRTARGKELLGELVQVSDAVTENFAAGVMERLGFGYDQLRELRPDIVYVSNCGFGHTGPYRPFKSWGPIVQAVSGLTHTSGLPGHGAGRLGLLVHGPHGRLRDGHRPARRAVPPAAHGRGPVGRPGVHRGRHRDDRPGRRSTPPSTGGRSASRARSHANRDPYQSMVPHGIYPCRGEDSWVAIACRHDDDWAALADVIGEPWAKDAGAGDRRRPARRPGRARRRPRRVDGGPGPRRRRSPRSAPPASRRRRCKRPPERCDGDADNEAWGLWPTVQHTKHGALRVDGQPVHLSATDWRIRRGGPVLGEDNERVLTEVLGLTTAEIGRLAAEGVI